MLAFFCPDGDTKCKRGKRNGVVDRTVDGVVDGVVDSAIFRGSYQGLGLAEDHRGLCRAQPVTLPRGLQSLSKSPSAFYSLFNCPGPILGPLSAYTVPVPTVKCPV